MKPLPAPEVLARLLSQVTSMMLGVTFAPVEEPTDTGGAWRTAELPIPGARPITIGISTDRDSCEALSSVIFSCGKDLVDDSMCDDALRELTNMTAGLIKTALALDQCLGLPKVRRGGAAARPPPMGQSVMLKAQQMGLLLWVSEGCLPEV
jgi:hypothetical protein